MKAEIICMTENPAATVESWQIPGLERYVTVLIMYEMRNRFIDLFFPSGNVIGKGNRLYSVDGGESLEGKGHI